MKTVIGVRFNDASDARLHFAAAASRIGDSHGEYYGRPHGVTRIWRDTEQLANHVFVGTALHLGPRLDAILHPFSMAGRLDIPERETEHDGTRRSAIGWQSSAGNILVLSQDDCWIDIVAAGRRHGIPWYFLESRIDCADTGPGGSGLPASVSLLDILRTEPTAITEHCERRDAQRPLWDRFGVLDLREVFSGIGRSHVHVGSAVEAGGARVLSLTWSQRDWAPTTCWDDHHDRRDVQEQETEQETEVTDADEKS